MRDREVVLRGEAAMSPASQILCTSALTYGVPLLLAWRELRLLGRLPPKPRDAGPEPEPVVLPWPGAGGRDLPECLRPRVLEDA